MAELCKIIPQFYTKREVAVKSYLVKDLMVPLSEYATVTEDATLYESVQSLAIFIGDRRRKNCGHFASDRCVCHSIPQDERVF